MPHSAMSPNNVAVITGGASGIGLAAAMRFARLGMKVCIADLGTDRLAEAEAKLLSVAPGGAANIMARAVDVSRIEDVSELEVAVRERFGGADILMNNAGIQPGSKMFGPAENWRRDHWRQPLGRDSRLADFRAAHDRARAARPRSSTPARSRASPRPPGDPAYNVSKAGVKAFTEALQHELRNTAGCRISAHLLIPGLRLHRPDRATAAPKSRPAPGRRSKPSTS